MDSLHLRFDPLLSRPNTFRVERMGRFIAVQAMVRMTDVRPLAPVGFFCAEYGRDVPHDRSHPALIRLGESEWRVEASIWPPSSGLPKGVSLVLTGWNGGR